MQYRLDYEWMTSRLMKLQQEYDTAFMIMSGKMPQQRAPQPRQAAQQQQRRRR